MCPLNCSWCHSQVQPFYLRTEGKGVEDISALLRPCSTLLFWDLGVPAEVEFWLSELQSKKRKSWRPRGEMWSIELLNSSEELYKVIHFFSVIWTQNMPQKPTDKAEVNKFTFCK